MICTIQHDRLNKKDHKTRKGIEPASSDHRPAALPFKITNHYLSYKSNCTSHIHLTMDLFVLSSEMDDQAGCK